MIRLTLDNPADLGRTAHVRAVPGPDRRLSTATLVLVDMDAPGERCRGISVFSDLPFHRSVLRP
jgi:hypothetical protein